MARTLGGGPRLNVQEWIALIHIHRTNNGTVLAADHPDLVAASPKLARLAEMRGSARYGTKLRSPEGLARRLTVLRQAERGDLTQLPRDGLSAWRQFEQDPENANATALLILELPNALCRAECSAIDPTLFSSEAETTASRGPPPFVGMLNVERLGAPEWVYLMVLEGDVLGSSSTDPPYIKVGRSCDIERRRAELNQGFPPGLGIQWQTFHVLGPMDPVGAHVLEQEILTTLVTHRLAIGREFCRGAPSSLCDLANAIAARNSHALALPSHETPANAATGLEGAH
jgi:hypothetical protein